MLFILAINRRSAILALTRRFHIISGNGTKANKYFAIQNAITGHWIEDEYQRENIDDYLHQMGMEWFKVMFAQSMSWQDEMTIYFDNEYINIDGVRGPLAESYQYHIKLDNQTLSLIDIGEEFGGITNATAEVRNNSMICYVFKPGSSEPLFTVTDHLDPQTKDKLNIENRHVDSNVVWKSVFKRKTKVDTVNLNLS